MTMQDLPSELRRGVGDGHDPYDVRDAEELMDKAAAEIERLRAYQNDAAKAWTKLTESQEREIEQLRAERDQYLKSAVEYGNLSERLRAALKAIRSLTAKHDLPDAWKIADRALTVEQSASGEVK